MGADLTADLATCVAEARDEIEEDSFASWDAYFAFERESLGTVDSGPGGGAPGGDARGATGASCRSSSPRPSARSNTAAAGSRSTDTYPLVAAAGVPVLLLTAPEPEVPEAGEAVERFRAALPEARVESMPDGIHDLVSYAPARVADLIGEFFAGRAAGQPPP